ncbi:MAG: dihydrolipoamide acetyltransferase family protein [Candidatus Promineifilaceae bacterium]
MPTPFIMPKYDMDQSSAIIVEWLKKEGDFVVVDEGVLIVETEKVAMEVAAPVSGILAGIRAEAGAEVPVTEVIAYILGEGETQEDIPEQKPEEMPTIEKVHPQQQHEEVIGATPVAARMALEMGIDLGDVDCEGDRIRKSDVERYAARAMEPHLSSRTGATPAARRLAREMGIDIQIVSGSGPYGRVQQEDIAAYRRQMSARPGIHDREYELLPMSSIRRTIADRMQSSFQTAPHISLSIDVDVTNIERVRQEINAENIRNNDEKISLTALLIFAAAKVLKRHKIVNASYLDEQIYLWKDINIGVATAVDEGLVVPVIHRASDLSLTEIHQELLNLVSKARAGSLSLADVRGGTFTISNLGMFGIHQFRAIINPPEAAILAVGAVIRKPVVTSDRDEVEIHPVMNLTLSADHRVLDGVTAARFLSDLAGFIQKPPSLP